MSKIYIDENRIELSKHLDYISEFVVNDYYDELREKIENVAIDEGIIDDSWSDNDANRLIVDVIKMIGDKLQKV
tara:strand:- start:67 stop:288 length:222 start_codon:yes stop_codon:yes gene_type:complete